MNRYLFSPEFQRQLWLKFSLLRLLFPPIALLCVVYSHYMIYNQDWTIILAERLLWIYMILVGILGNHEAANTMRDEVRANTWDMQRMTPSSPASLIFGKIFGSTSFIWYAALPVLFTALALYHIKVPVVAGEDLLGRPLRTHFNVPTVQGSLYFLFFMIMGGVLGHALAFLVSFDGMVGKIETDPRNRRPRTVMAFLAGLGVSWALIDRVGKEMMEHGGGASSAFRYMKTLNWYNFEMPTEAFILAAVVFFTFWVCVGLYRLARAEMMYPLTPLFWFLGVGSISLFLGGLAFEPRMATRGSIFEDYRQYAFPFYIFTSTLAATYYAMFAGAGDLRRYGRMWESFRGKNTRKVFENLPQWLASLALVLAAYAFVLYVVWQPVSGVGALFVTPGMYITLATTLVLFALRDGLAMHMITALSTGATQKFERGAYYVFMYFLLPAMHLTIALKGIAVNPMRFLAIAQGQGSFHPVMYFGWYYPNIFPGFVYGVLPVLVQILFIGIVYMVLRRRGDEPLPPLKPTKKSAKQEEVTWTS